MNPDRRRFLALGAALALARPAFAAPGERSLVLHNLHTGESVGCVYWAEGRYLDEGVADLARVLRDHRSNEVGPIATGLLDLLHGLGETLPARGAIEIISGYRSPATNDLLARSSSGVARNSLHTRGLAADIRVPGCTLADLRRVALDRRSGGVGYYPGSGFVHVDVGRVRAWVG